MADRRTPNPTYSIRELDMMFKGIHEKLDLKHTEDNEWHERIELQTIKHNGRLTKMERGMLIFGTALVVLLVTNGSKLLQVFKILI